MKDDYNPLKHGHGDAISDDYEALIHGHGDGIAIEGGGGA